MAVSPSSKHSNQLCRPALQRLTEWGEEDLLQSILEKLPPAILLQAARVLTLLSLFDLLLVVWKKPDVEQDKQISIRQKQTIVEHCQQIVPL
jgi:hypothetical protein